MDQLLTYLLYLLLKQIIILFDEFKGVFGHEDLLACFCVLKLFRGDKLGKSDLFMKLLGMVDVGLDDDLLIFEVFKYGFNRGNLVVFLGLKFNFAIS